MGWVRHIQVYFSCRHLHKSMFADMIKLLCIIVFFHIKGSSEVESQSILCILIFTNYSYSKCQHIYEYGFLSMVSFSLFNLNLHLHKIILS